MECVRQLQYSTCHKVLKDSHETNIKVKTSEVCACASNFALPFSSLKSVHIVLYYNQFLSKYISYYLTCLIFTFLLSNPLHTSI